ncbi:MAG TPA: hypothetical protein VLB75_08055, partial [Steroidobacteraceae bacterium]|nr:hypothetical protein [Steroidobacteraceae bacterium]
IRITAWDETNTRIRAGRIIREIRAGGGRGLVCLVGVQTNQFPRAVDIARPLLGAGIPVCEHMTNLAAAPRTGGWLHAVPIAWKGGATFPVRAYLLVE